MNIQPLPDELLERVLARLEISRQPDPTPESLRAIYAAWCRRVPFDNVRKLIRLRLGNTGQLPGDTSEDFFEAWLRHGAGGTCWPGAGACQALLQSLGFEAVRGIGTMLVVPGLPPNHGTVRVTFDRAHFLWTARSCTMNRCGWTQAPTCAWRIRHGACVATGTTAAGTSPGGHCTGSKVWIAGWKVSALDPANSSVVMSKRVRGARSTMNSPSG